MSRKVRLALGLALGLFVSAQQADAQFFYPNGMGYGGGGWGGWGGTAQGDIARGMGAYAAGAGVYNYQTAQARAINTNTLMQFNEYLYQSQQVANRRYAQLMADRSQRSNAAFDATQKRLRENPTQSDIFRGDALNVLLDQLTNPRFSSGSSLGRADLRLPGKTIRSIPFFFAPEALTICLQQLTEEKSWPLVLRSDKFAAERAAYIEAVKALVDEDKQPEELSKVRASIQALHDKIEATIPRTQMPDYRDATRYVKGLAGVAKMMEKPKFEKALDGLDEEKQATVGELIGFMSNYNLRFGPATTPAQRAAYTALFPALSSQVNRLMDGSPGTPIPQGDLSKAPGELFQDVDPKHLHPAPPAPGR